MESYAAKSIKVHSGDKISVATPVKQTKSFKFKSVASSMKSKPRTTPVQSNKIASSVSKSYSEHETDRMFMIKPYRDLYNSINRVTTSELRYMSYNVLSKLNEQNNHYNLLSEKQLSDKKEVENKRNITTEDFIHIRLMLNELDKSIYLHNERKSYDGYISSAVSALTMGSSMLGSKWSVLKDICEIIQNHKTSILEYCMQYAQDQYELLGGNVSNRKSLMSVGTPILVSVGGVVLAKLFGMGDMSKLVLQMMNSSNQSMSEDEKKEAEEDDNMY